jgi:hypothetical protein
MPLISSPTTFYYHPLQDDGAQGETNLHALLKNMHPQLNEGEYVFCTVDNHFTITPGSIVCLFKETEGTTLILNKQTADALHLPYSYVAAWITLTVHSSLQATGLTAAFSTALAKAGISCNVVAAFYHDHIFVDKKDGEKAIAVLKALAQSTL